MDQKSYPEKIRVSFDIDLGELDQESVQLLLSNVSWKPFETNPILLAFGAYRLLVWVIETTHPDAYKNYPKAAAFVALVRDLMQNLADNNISKPL